MNSNAPRDGPHHYQIRRHGNGWAITTDSVWTFAPVNGGTSSSSMANMVEAYQHWTGGGWRPTSQVPMVFPTELAAAEYAKLNAHRM